MYQTLSHKNCKAETAAKREQQRKKRILTKKLGAYWTRCAPYTYFDDQHELNKQTKGGGAAAIRSIAIIAHVDHGKTTLSDALLHKAGLIHKDRVGDQTTGRSLDTLQDEKDRGITIKSAAITLQLQARRDLVLPDNLKTMPIDLFVKHKDSALMKEEVPTNVDAVAKDDTDELALSDIYLGNLPRNVSKETLKNFLSDCDIVVPDDDSTINLKREYAIVSGLESSLATKLLGLHGQSFEGRPLVVEVAGDAPMKRLMAACQAQGKNMPTLSTIRHEDGDIVKYQGLATWPAMGGILLHAPSLYDTQKLARQAVAEHCLQFLQQQNHDHQNVTVMAAGEVAKVPLPSSEHKQDLAQSSTTTEPFLDDEDIVLKDTDLVPLVLNLIDSPGHIDFNAEVTSALRVSDGALVVVDAVEGKAVQTEEVLIQALREGVKPVLMLNKVDRLFIDKQMTAEEVYDAMIRVMNDINDFIHAHQLAELPDQRVSLKDGSVCFGSGYFGWSCSIDAILYRCYPDKSPEELKGLRATLAERENFIQHILKPIRRVHRACGVLPKVGQANKSDEDPTTRVTNILSKLPGVSGRRLLGAGEDASTIQPRKLLKKAMMAWLPAADALVDMIAKHVPSPVEAQKVRARLLYSGDVGDPCGKGIFNCDPSGPTVVYISKMAPSLQGKRLLAFGRVFSGTLHTGDVLRALRTDGTEGTAKVSQIKICGLGGRMHKIASASAGQLVALEGVDQALSKAGTLTSALDGKPIRHMLFAVTPIVQHSVRPKDKRSLTKLVAELHQIVNADSTALFYKDKETQEYILAGAGELHIEILVSLLKQNSGLEIELSEPIIAYRETVQSMTTEAALAKSENKHNRIWFKASPLPVDLIAAMTSGDLVNLDSKAFSKALVKDYGWKSTETARIWAIGPEPLSRGDETNDMDQPTCMLVDATFGLQIPDDAKENIIGAFKQVVCQGILVNAPMQGVRFELVDAKFHSDAVHRRPNSVVPASRRSMLGAFLKANPCLREPVYRVDISGAQGSLNESYSVLGKRNGTIVDASTTLASDTIHARVPVRCAFGLAGELRLATHGHAHTSTVFDGMQLVPSEEEFSIIRETRLSKDLDEKLPAAEDFIDRM